MNIYQKLRTLLFALVLLVLSMTAQAGLKVSPAYIDIGRAEPGSTVTVKLTIKNTGEQVEYINTRIDSPTKDASEEWRHNSTDENFRSLKEWVSIKQTDFK